MEIKIPIEEIPAKTILSGYSTGEEWFGNNYNMNLYKGCCHGCIYCDSRSECYGVEDFDRVRTKKNLLEILEKELKAKRKTGVIGCGAMSDPYNPFEKTLCLSRRAFSLINRYRYGLSVITKSALVTRDIDIFSQIKEHSPILIKTTITTPHDGLAKKLEPNVSPPSERFDAISKLRSAEITCGVLMMPCLPFIEDSPEDILLLVNRAKEAGAYFVFADFGVTLRQNQRDWFYKKLDESFPDMEYKKMYIETYGNSYQCGSPRYNELKNLFQKECERLGLIYSMEGIRRLYKENYSENEQLTLY